MKNNIYYSNPPITKLVYCTENDVFLVKLQQISNAGK